MTVEEYLDRLPDERRDIVKRILACIKRGIPPGFTEEMSYGMPGFVVPHSVYPAGYHCKPEEPLPFISVDSKKKSVNFYHMGIYARPELLEWFVGEWKKTARHALDFGKSCFRFAWFDEIPWEALETLAGLISMQEWIDEYRKGLHAPGKEIQ